MVALSKEIPRQEIIPFSNGSPSAENRQTVQPLATYLPEVFAGFATEQPIDLDELHPATTTILLATWNGMSVQEMAYTAQTVPTAIVDIRTRGYAALQGKSVESINPEDHFSAITRALETRSIELSGFVDKKKFDNAAGLFPAELDEAEKFGRGNDVSKVPQGGEFNFDLFQRRICLDTVQEKLGENPAEVAFYAAIVKKARRIAQERAHAVSNHPNYPTAA